jgi:hypothetical protein
MFSADLGLHLKEVNLSRLCDHGQSYLSISAGRIVLLSCAELNSAHKCLLPSTFFSSDEVRPTDLLRFSILIGFVILFFFSRAVLFG